MIRKITISSDTSTGNSDLSDTSTSNGEEQKLEQFEFEDNDDDQELKSSTCCFIC